MKDPPAWGLVAMLAILTVMLAYTAARTEKVLGARRQFMQGDDRDPDTRKLIRGFAVLSTFMMLAPVWQSDGIMAALAMAGPIAGFFSLWEVARWREWPRFTVLRITGAALALAAVVGPAPGDTLFRVAIGGGGLVMMLWPRGLAFGTEERLVAPAEILVTRMVAASGAVFTGVGAILLAARALWHG